MARRAGGRSHGQPRIERGVVGNEAGAAGDALSVNVSFNMRSRELKATLSSLPRSDPTNILQDTNNYL